MFVPCVFDCVQRAARLTVKNRNEQRGMMLMIEQRLDFSCYVPDGFGTGDCIIIADRTLHIIDFKYSRYRRSALPSKTSKSCRASVPNSA